MTTPDRNASSQTFLFQVEDAMKLSLKEVMRKAVEAYPVTPRNEWVINWPGQVVLASSTIHWTTEVSEVSNCVSST